MAPVPKAAQAREMEALPELSEEHFFFFFLDVVVYVF